MATGAPSSAAALKPLTPKQAAYRDARISGHGPSDAYRIAYDAKRMSPKAISVEAARLDAHPAIALAIREAQRATQAKALITREMVINGLLDLAQGTDIPPATRRAAWRDLGEHLAMFKLVVDHNRVEELARSLGLDPSEVQAEAEAILKGAR